MRRTILFTASLAAAIGLVALGAQAQSAATKVEAQKTQAQTGHAMSIGQIATMLEDKGYRLLEIELEHGRYEVEMIDADGMRVETYLSPITGDVLPYRDDDDDRGLDRDDDRYDKSDD